MWVGFQYTLCPREPSLFLYISTSRNGKWPSSTSMVNFILLFNPLRWSKNSVSLSRPWGQMAKVLSTLPTTPLAPPVPSPADFPYKYHCSRLLLPYFTLQPMKMDLIDGSETSAIINQTPGNYPKGNLLYTDEVCLLCGMS